MKEPKIYSRSYKSGFSAQIIEMPGFNQKFFGIVVDFGSSDENQIPGSAHFLEHKLFAKRNGDLSMSFEELGAGVNAFTSYNETMFYASSLDNSIRVTELLFKLVGEPYFTVENVAQEAPIIIQELAMYQSEPNWRVNNALMSNLFGTSNLAQDIAGTRDSINSITPESLMQVYRDNYTTSNMRFVAAGDFSQNAINTIFRDVNKLQEQYLSVAEKPKHKSQPDNAKFKNFLAAADIQVPIFGVGIKLPDFKNFLASNDLTQILLEIMLESKLGAAGPWLEQQRQKNILQNPLQIVVNYTRQGNFATIFGTSNNPQKAVKAIIDELHQPLVQKPEAANLYQHLFDLQKKDWLAQSIRLFNNVSAFAVEYAEESIDGENIFRNIKDLQAMGFDQYSEITTEILRNSQIVSGILDSNK